MFLTTMSHFAFVYFVRFILEASIRHYVYVTNKLAKCKELSIQWKQYKSRWGYMKVIYRPTLKLKEIKLYYKEEPTHALQSKLKSKVKRRLWQRKPIDLYLKGFISNLKYLYQHKHGFVKMFYHVDIIPTRKTHTFFGENKQFLIEVDILRLFSKMIL